jgi:hypothetical protein
MFEHPLFIAFNNSSTEFELLARIFVLHSLKNSSIGFNWGFTVEEIIIGVVIG